MPDKSEAPLQFQLRKLGHVVLNVTDLERSVRFYTDLLGLEISDRYPDSMVPGGMVFMRCNADHHGVALVAPPRGRGRQPAAGPASPPLLRVSARAPRLPAPEPA